MGSGQRSGGGPVGAAGPAPRRRDRVFDALRAILRGPAPPVAAPAIAFGDGPLTPVDPGVTVLRAAVAQGVELDHFCGGKASCSTCRVEVIEGAAALAPLSPKERLTLGPARAAAGDRLACQAQIRGAVRVRVPSRF